MHADGGDLALDASTQVAEFKCVCDFMRQYATLRFYQLALLLGTTGSIVTALSSNLVRVSAERADFLKTGGLLVTLALMVMEFRASSHCQSLRDRGNELAASLRFRPFPVNSRWSPLTTTGVGFYLHAAVALAWVASFQLFIPRTS
jgi:hypothetical protein